MMLIRPGGAGILGAVRRRPAAVSSPELWTPALLTSATIEFWFDAQDAATITKDGSGLVSQWDDKSGNSRNAARGTSSGQPLYNSANADMNGLPTIGNIDGGDGLIMAGYSAPVSWPFVDTGQPSIYMGAPGEVYCLGVTLGQHILSTVYPGGGDVNSGQNLHWIDGELQANALDNTTGDPAAAGAMFFAGRFRGNGFDGSSQYLFGGNAILNRTAGDRTAEVDAGEIMHLSGTLATEERQLIEGYLAWRWETVSALASGHPFKVAAPTTADAYTGG